MLSLYQLLQLSPQCVTKIFLVNFKMAEVLNSTSMQLKSAYLSLLHDQQAFLAPQGFPENLSFFPRAHIPWLKKFFSEDCLTLSGPSFQKLLSLLAKYFVTLKLFQNQHQISSDISKNIQWMMLKFFRNLTLDIVQQNDLMHDYVT